MKEQILSVPRGNGLSKPLPLRRVHTLIIGSGAAGLAAAVRLRAVGVDDILMVTEGLDKGTSINTGSDKQTYYKLSMCGDDSDSPMAMAQTYFAGGGMHGDLALVEASLSAPAFIHLVNLGVPFPRDPFGQFVGYKTDHDPRRRATSIGPYTSREMCRALIRRVQELEIPVLENRNAVELLTMAPNTDGSENQPTQNAGRRAVGALFTDPHGGLEAVGAENVVFATGGPGGLYRSSVYPHVHNGAIGLALLAGAEAQNLPESQFGLASTAFRWNVSGTFMQVVPRFISIGRDEDPGAGGREFLREYFDSSGQMCSHVFLKGYQWPFDSRKLLGGSSLVDLLVYIETELNGRRVFLDFRRNSAEYRLDDLDAEAREYLQKSAATQDTPIERLRHMNPGAVALYADNGIDITAEPLQIAVCAQHNNGGLAANHWWESTNISHLFPIGEVNGSHGVYRPGGSALNSGQVGAFRAAEFIAARYAENTLDESRLIEPALASAAAVFDWLERSKTAPATWQSDRRQLQSRMTRAAAHIRSPDELHTAVADAWRQWQQLTERGTAYDRPADAGESLRTRQLCFAHAVYIETVRFAVQSGLGSRGSAMVVDSAGVPVHHRLAEKWRMAPENTAFRGKVLSTLPLGDTVENTWTERSPIPQSDLWFETVWSKFRDGEIYSADL